MKNSMSVEGLLFAPSLAALSIQEKTYRPNGEWIESVEGSKSSNISKVKHLMPPLTGPPRKKPHAAFPTYKTNVPQMLAQYQNLVLDLTICSLSPFIAVCKEQ